MALEQHPGDTKYPLLICLDEKLNVQRHDGSSLPVDVFSRNRIFLMLVGQTRRLCVHLDQKFCVYLACTCLVHHVVDNRALGFQSARSKADGVADLQIANVKWLVWLSVTIMSLADSDYRLRFRLLSPMVT